MKLRYQPGEEFDKVLAGLASINVLYIGSEKYRPGGTVRVRNLEHLRRYQDCWLIFASSRFDLSETFKEELAGRNIATLHLVT